MPLKPLVEDQDLAQSLVGRTIQRVLWFDADPDNEWSGHETAWLWLDDGRVIILRQRDRNLGRTMRPETPENVREELEYHFKQRQQGSTTWRDRNRIGVSLVVAYGVWASGIVAGFALGFLIGKVA